MNRDNLVAVALGEQPADLVILNGQYVNVYSGEIYPGGIATSGDRIAAVGDVDYCIGDKTRVLDAQACFLVPGLIDTHIHVGASSLVMTEFARLVVPKGTAVIVTDFTEMGKMRGVRGMRFFLDESASTPLKVYFSPFFTTLLGIDGKSSMTIEEMYEILQWKECKELREWNMHVERHQNENLAALGKYARELGLMLCGHMEGQYHRTLQASVATGAYSDHEAGSANEAIERARLGVAVQMRYSSASNDMQHLLTAITQYNCDPRLFMFSTDEEDVDEIFQKGHIDHRIRAAISVGIEPIEAIRMGSLNAATYLEILGDYGSLTPGRVAFINLVDNLKDFNVLSVIHGNQEVAQSGKYIAPIDKPNYPSDFFNTINLKNNAKAEDFVVSIEPDREEILTRVIGVFPYQVVTDNRKLTLPTDRGNVVTDVENDVAKISVVERHAGSGKLSTAFIQGFGIKRGAFGASYHPGPIHISVVGIDEVDMALVVNRISELQGGFVAALDGKVIAEVALPVLGFMSEEDADTVAKKFIHVKLAISDKLGVTFPGIFTMMAYICIPGVEPHLRMSVNGLLQVEHVENQLIVQPISLFPDLDQ